MNPGENVVRDFLSRPSTSSSRPHRSGQPFELDADDTPTRDLLSTFARGTEPTSAHQDYNVHQYRSQDAYPAFNEEGRTTSHDQIYSPSQISLSGHILNSLPFYHPNAGQHMTNAQPVAVSDGPSSTHSAAYHEPYALQGYPVGVPSSFQFATDSTVYDATPHGRNLGAQEAFKSYEDALQALHRNSPSRGRRQRDRSRMLPPPSSQAAPPVRDDVRTLLPSQTARRWEYTLRVSSDVHVEEDNDNVYDYLDKNQKMLITDRIQQIRPYSESGIRKTLISYMTTTIAQALLSDNEQHVESAVNALYPIEMRKSGTSYTPWMTGFTNAQRRQIIEEFAEATLQSVDDLRNLFLRRMMSPEQAVEIHLATPQQRLAIAHRDALILPVNKRHLPWQRGLSKVQRRAVVQRMRITARISESYCYELFQRIAEPGYGLTMLRANDAEFKEIMNELRDIKTAGE
ncbi:hypothetical protein CBS101457_000182 [Exobasidium rhododendri]|nr:hypothetical protein CBS101457_000182 [Exobasidium rhododendri]